MNFGIIQRIVGISLLVYSPLLLIPAAIATIDAHGAPEPFLFSFAITLLGGLLLWYPYRRARRELRVREGFALVTLFWFLITLFASLPFHFSGEQHFGFTNAFFETVSGLTTTGATIVEGIEHLPPALLWYRQQLQWFGGLAVAIIALAIFPVLSVGGMQLYRTETFGPSQHEHLLPRLKQASKTFLNVYLGITIACGFAYALAGMDVFDAAAHALSTVSTGGFSTHDANMAFFQNRWIELVCIVFMIVGGISFAVHYQVFRKGELGRYWRHTETRVFLAALAILAVTVSAYLLLVQHGAAGETIMNAVFQVVAMLTTSGFRTESFDTWPGFIPVLLIFVSVMGACAGSTSGGMKTARFLLVYKQGVRETVLLIHPSAVAPVKFGKRIVAGSMMEAVWGFFAAYTLVYVILLLLFMASGLDQVTAFSAVAATLNNLGPGLGEVAQSFQSVSEFGKWVGITAMLLGRLEIFVLLVLLTPEFWRH